MSGLDEATAKPFLSAAAWPTNADLIAEVAELFVPVRPFAIDLTYNTGKWWKKYRPFNLFENDLDERYGSWHDDFRCTSWAAETFDLVAYDPPYQAQGGRKTSTIPSMNDAYGRDLSAKTPAANQQLINDGLTEAVRICAVDGIVLVKVMDYITSGKLWLGCHHTLTHALTLPVRVEAIYHHVGGPGPQPRSNLDGTDRVQKHPRNNASMLYVLRKIKPTTREKKQ